jgi:hypothetical protein|tara:strand:+ start:137 stop:697 length:561 start_codon:yes stop_codon:yes gene_type:complete
MFKDYLTEAKKEYKFSIGVAGPMPEGFEDTMEEALRKYSVNSISPGKRTPIQEKPLDFPQLSNCEVTYFEVSVAYPTTPQVLEEYIPMCCGVAKTNIIVRTENDPRIEYQDTKEEDPYQSKLETEEMGSATDKPQEQVGGERVMSLLKELETARKEKENDPIADVKPGDTKDISDNVGTTSPIGSK